MPRTEPKHLRVRVYWGDILYDTSVFSPHQSVSVGQKDSDFLLDLGGRFPKNKWTLAEVSRESALVSFAEGQTGYLRSSTQVTPFRKLVEDNRAFTSKNGLRGITLTQNDEADVVAGQVTFHLDWVTKSEKVPRKSPFRLKPMAILGALISAMVGAYFLISSMEFPQPLATPTERLVTILPPEEPKAEPPPPPPVVEEKPVETKPEVVAPIPVKKTVKAKPAPAPVAPKPPVEESLGNLAQSLTSLDTKAKAAKATRRPSGTLNQIGTGGLPAAVANGETERLEKTEGQGKGEYDTNTKVAMTNPKPAAEDTPKGLSRSVIDSVIRTRGDRFRRCYEKELAFSPTLAGEITLNFQISPAGKVIKARVGQNTLGNAKVASCVLTEMETTSFPRPAGNSIVKVEYPFSFEPRH